MLLLVKMVKNLMASVYVWKCRKVPVDPMTGIVEEDLVMIAEIVIVIAAQSVVDAEPISV